MHRRCDAISRPHMLEPPTWESWGYGRSSITRERNPRRAFGRGLIGPLQTIPSRDVILALRAPLLPHTCRLGRRLGKL
eukprot:8859847-Pyramimonas_sp.AAC.1